MLFPWQAHLGGHGSGLGLRSRLSKLGQLLISRTLISQRMGVYVKYIVWTHFLVLYTFRLLLPNTSTNYLKIYSYLLYITFLTL